MMPTLGLRAYEKLRDMLVTGHLQPGMQLVNRKLADEIGMSMTPVREAVTRLASEGLVEYVPGAGAFVRRISRQELAQLYDVRRALESLAAKEAAEHATAGDIAELRAITADSFTIIRAIADSAEGHATPEQMARWVDDEQRFHMQLFRAARNTWLSKLAADLKLLALGFSPQRRIPTFLTVKAAVSTWREHRRLVRALATRNPALAAATIDEHIAAGKREVFSHLAADGGLRGSLEGEQRSRRRKKAARLVSRPVARRASAKTATPGGRRRSRG
jgi:DNA-binding GntR family transcriptional regulator